ASATPRSTRSRAGSARARSAGPCSPRRSPSRRSRTAQDSRRPGGRKEDDVVRNPWRTGAPLLVLLLAAGALPVAAMPAQTALPQTAQEDEELVLNGTFDETHKPWWSNAGMTPNVS